LHSLSDNKRYEIPLPDKKEIDKFESLIEKIKNYRVGANFIKNPKKCSQCIYKPLCY